MTGEGTKAAVHVPHKELAGAVAQVQSQMSSVPRHFPQVRRSTRGTSLKAPLARPDALAYAAVRRVLRTLQDVAARLQSDARMSPC